jgi:hypothetical protein
MAWLQLSAYLGALTATKMFLAEDNLAKKGMRFTQSHFYTGEWPAGIITRRMAYRYI